jgi:hypothetical protein
MARTVEEVELRRSRRGLTALQFVLLVVLVIALGYVNRIITTQLEAGDDFAIGWSAGDLWLHQRTSPYDPQVADAAQQLIYGRTSPADVLKRPALFLLPFPAMLFYLPFSAFAFPLARTAWMTIAEVCLLASVVLSFRLVHWRGSPWLSGLMLVFAVLWYHGAQAVISGSFASVEVLLLVGAILAVHRRLDSVAGLLLGLSSLMPQLSIFMIAFALVWGIAGRRWELVLWTCGSVLVLYGLAIAVLPSWPLQWIGQLLMLFRTTDSQPVLLAILRFIPDASPWALAGLYLLSLIYLGWEWTAVMNQEDRWFSWTSALTLSSTALLTYKTTTAAYVILLPGLILPLTVWLERWGQRAGWGAGFVLVVLAGGLWWLFFHTAAGGQESLLLFLPAPVLTLVELWWVRWWASRSTRLPL